MISPFVRAFLFLFDSLIGLVVLIVIVNVVISWLVAFDVINLRNPTMYRFVKMLDGVTEPMLRPIRRVLPHLGGIDLSPIILLLLLKATQIIVDGLLRPYAYGVL
jgi:YggT family protein